MGIELIDQVKDLDVVLVPVGGAGLIAGMNQSYASSTASHDSEMIMIC